MNSTGTCELELRDPISKYLLMYPVSAFNRENNCCLIHLTYCTCNYVEVLTNRRILRGTGSWRGKISLVSNNYSDSETWAQSIKRVSRIWKEEGVVLQRLRTSRSPCRTALTKSRTNLVTEALPSLWFKTKPAIPHRNRAPIAPHCRNARGAFSRNLQNMNASKI